MLELLPLPPVVAALLAGSLAAGLLSAWRRDAAASQAVAVAALVGLLLLLRSGGPEPEPAARLGAPLAGALVVGLFALAAHRSLVGSTEGGSLALLAAATGAASAALLAADLPTVYAGAALASVAAWAAAAVERAGWTGRAAGGRALAAGAAGRRPRPARRPRSASAARSGWSWPRCPVWLSSPCRRSPSASRACRVGSSSASRSWPACSASTCSAGR